MAYMSGSSVHGWEGLGLREPFLCVAFPIALLSAYVLR